MYRQTGTVSVIVDFDLPKVLALGEIIERMDGTEPVDLYLEEHPSGARNASTPREASAQQVSHEQGGLLLLLLLFAVPIRVERDPDNTVEGR